jgi:hypothetical protein
MIPVGTDITVIKPGLKFTGWKGTVSFHLGKTVDGEQLYTVKFKHDERQWGFRESSIRRADATVRGCATEAP